MMGSTPTPSTVSSVQVTPRQQLPPSYDQTSTYPGSQIPPSTPCRQGDWPRYHVLPEVAAGQKPGMVDHQASPAYAGHHTNSLFPFSLPEAPGSTSASSFTSPRPSARARGHKRAMSTSTPSLTSDSYIDLLNCIRSSPTNLPAPFCAASRGSSSSHTSPMQHAIGHMFATKSSSGSPSVAGGILTHAHATLAAHQRQQLNHQLHQQAHKNNDFGMDAGNVGHYTTMGQLETGSNLYVGNMENLQVVIQADGPVYPAGVDAGRWSVHADHQQIAAGGADEEVMPPPPPYSSHHSRQQYDTSPGQPDTDTVDENTDIKGEPDDGVEKQPVCKWIECNQGFSCQTDLVKHLEKQHIDQRRGEDYTCYWSCCPRRFKPFNARYKLLIHMRVHSGEKPNKCTVSNRKIQHGRHDIMIRCWYNAGPASKTVGQQ